MSDTEPTFSEKLSPHSIEAEEAVLGAVLMNPDSAIEIGAFLHTADFFIVKHAWVWDAIQDVLKRGDALDSLTVTDELRRRNQIDSIGGPSFILYLMNNTPTHLHAETYARYVERAAIRRRMLAGASDIANVAIQEGREIDDQIAECEKILAESVSRTRPQDLTKLSDLVDSYRNWLEYHDQHPDELIGIPTSFADLDQIVHGMRKDNLIYLAGRPGTGKTALALNIATNAAIKYGARIGIFSMEMSLEEVAERIISSLAHIDSDLLQEGKLSAEDWSRFYNQIPTFEKLPIYVDDTPAIKPEELRAKVRKMRREHGIDLVIVDYVQLMVLAGKPENRVAEVTAISASLKALAKEFHIPILALAQLNRGTEGRGDHRPQLSDLRESGSLEQDADGVWMLYRDDMYNENSAQPNVVEVLIRKHRKGKLGMAKLVYRGQFTQFVGYTDPDVHHIDLKMMGGDDE